MSSDSTKYLIIGNSAGAIGAAEAIRSVDSSGALTIVSDEPYPAYSRPLISEYLAGTRTLGTMLYRPADFYPKNNITTKLGRKVVKLEPDKHTATLDSGEETTWEKLLLATGGVPIVPPMKGMPVQGVFNFTTLDDARAIDRHLNHRTKAVVIGGGLIGVSVTEALVKRGVQVSIVEMKDRILNLILDETASALEAQALKKAGVEIITNHTVAELISDTGDEVTAVRLDDGTLIRCNLVVIAIGVRPRTELAAGTSIKVNRGIVVDRAMRTSHPDVYACGDVSEAFDFVYRQCRPVPIWPNAYLGGRIAGLNMTGKNAEYPGGTAMNSLKYFGLDVVSAGMVNPPDASYEIISQTYGNAYHKIILKDDCVVGMVFAGDIERSGIIFNLMKSGAGAAKFKPLLVAKDFGLASLPGELWRPHFKAPEMASAIVEEEGEEVGAE